MSFRLRDTLQKRNGRDSRLVDVGGVYFTISSDTMYSLADEASFSGVARISSLVASAFTAYSPDKGNLRACRPHPECFLGFAVKEYGIVLHRRV